MSETGSFTQTQQQSAGQNEQKEKKDEDRRRGLIWWWIAAVLALIVAAGGAGYFGGFLGKGRAAKQKIEGAYFFRIDGKDTQSRAATFDFIILTDDFTWVKGSTTDVESHGQVIPQTDVAERVLSPKIRESLSSASDLIAVGLASQEGERTQEENRASERAKTIESWMDKLSNPGIGLWAMTFGQYNKACKKQEDADSSFERPLIMVGVRSKANGTNLQEALADAISGHDNLPSRDCYSRFEMSKVR